VIAFGFRTSLSEKQAYQVSPAQSFLSLASKLPLSACVKVDNKGYENSCMTEWWTSC